MKCFEIPPHCSLIQLLAPSCRRAVILVWVSPSAPPSPTGGHWEASGLWSLQTELLEQVCLVSGGMCSCFSRVDTGTWLDCTLGIRVPVSLGRHWGMAGLYSWRLLEFSSQTALQGGPSTAIPPITDEISGSSTSLPALGTVSLSSFSHSYKQWGLTRTCLPAICVFSLVKCPSNLCMLKIIGLFACYSTLRD